MIDLTESGLNRVGAAPRGSETLRGLPEWGNTECWCPLIRPARLKAKMLCRIRRTHRGRGSCDRHKGHDDPQGWRRVSGRVAPAAVHDATPPGGCGLS